MSSSSPTDFGTMTTPLRSNCQETAPGSAIEPPLRENNDRTSDPVRFRLSVRHSTIMATPEGRVALVGDRFVADPLKLAGTAFDGALDRVERHGRVPGLGEHGAEVGVRRHVTAALPSRHLDLADQLGEQLSPRGVNGALAMLGRRPFGVARHRLSLP